MAGPPSIFLSDRNSLSVQGLSRLLSDSGFVVTGAAGDMRAFLASLDRVGTPDLLLIDYDGELEDFSRELAEVRSAAPATRIVILTDRLRSDFLTQAFVVGTEGYLIKTISFEALVESLKLVLLGEKVFPTMLASLLVDGSAVGEPASVTASGLSAREREILNHLMAGHSNKVIGDRLRIAEATVKVHLKTLCRKIRVSNRTQAAIWALNNGFNPAFQRAITPLVSFAPLPQQAGRPSPVGCEPEDLRSPSGDGIVAAH